MASIFYYAAHDDSGSIFPCGDRHATVISAVACISWAGGFVRAVENGQDREFNEKEQGEFELAKAGGTTETRPVKLRFALLDWPQRTQIVPK
jgi:hypothetical protein